MSEKRYADYQSYIRSLERERERAEGRLAEARREAAEILRRKHYIAPARRKPKRKLRTIQKATSIVLKTKKRGCRVLTKKQARELRKLDPRYRKAKEGDVVCV